MGSIFHLFDFNQASTSKKLSQKDPPDGLEAPRNSLELPRETSQSFHAINDNIPYAYQVKQGSMAKNSYPRGEPMKKLIEEHLVKQTGTRRNVPSVVARLMGMDMLPPDVNQSNFTNNRKNDEPKRKSLLHEEAENGSTRRSQLGLKPVMQSERSLDGNDIKQDRRLPRTISKTRKAQPREHPQEEELQKFKKEFEAWQAAMFWERSRSVDVDNYPKVLKDDQFLARQYLNKEKMARYSDANQRAYQLPTTYERSVHGLQENYVDKVSQPYRKQAMHVRSRSMSNKLDQISFANQNPEKHSKPTRIVILKPGPEIDDETEDSWHGSSEREGSLEYFLEEVKERLRLEIQGNGRRSTTIRGRGVETPFKERPANPKDIARHIAKHVRENVTRDLGMNLLRSESTRSYRNEFQIAGQDSPDFTSRDTRKLLSERLTNVLRNEINVDNSKVNEGMAPRSASGVVNIGKEVPTWNGLKEEPEVISGSFRHQERNEDKFNTGDISPRSLVRSLSAPVSGTSFAKLLLEEPHVLTGAHIRRKLEETENLSNEVNKPRKDRFNLRGKVSHLRYSLTLKGKLFGKKIQFSSAESAAEQSDSVKAFVTTPMAVMNFGSALENSTEVPPSPASLCSSGHEEFPRPGDHPSPVSPLDVTFRDDHSVSQVFKEISSNIHELRQQLNRLQCDGWEEAGTTEVDPSVDSEIMELECEAQIYIRDILIAAGLFDGCTTVTKPIDNWVFKEVEESYRKGREGEGGITVDTIENHKVLFDLLNETLLIIIGSSTSRSRFMRQAVEPNPVVPHGKVLFENVWQKIRLYIYPPADKIYSLDNMVACDLRTTKWLDVVPYEIDGIGKDVEWMIWGDLVEEVMAEMCR